MLSFLVIFVILRQVVFHAPFFCEGNDDHDDFIVFKKINKI